MTDAIKSTLKIIWAMIISASIIIVGAIVISKITAQMVNR